MTTWPILSVTTFLPLFGAVLVYLLARGSDEAAARNARWIALWITLDDLRDLGDPGVRFDKSSTDFQFVEHYPWLAQTVVYHMGVDGISLSVRDPDHGVDAAVHHRSWKSVAVRVREYMMAFLVSKR